MQIKTELNDMFSYSLFPVIILFVITVIFLLYLIIIKNNKKYNIITPNKKKLLNIKNNYLNNLDILLNDYSNNIISKREAYHRLSLSIRNFIYETTNIKVQYFTLEDIKSIDIPILYDLVSEYYNPEFSRKSEGNFYDSIERTRMVISRWK